MYNIILWWSIITVVLFIIGAATLRVTWEACKLLIVLAFAGSIIILMGG